MKAKLIALPLAATAATILVGCTTTTETTTTANPPPKGVNTVSRTYTQSDLQRSGRANAGPALKTLDPDVQ